MDVSQLLLTTGGVEADARDSVCLRIHEAKETDHDRPHLSTVLPFVDLPPVEASPPIDNGAPLLLFSRSQAFALSFPDLGGDDKGRIKSRHSLALVSRFADNMDASTITMKIKTSNRLTGTEKKSIMSKAMLKKISMREGGETGGRTSAILKTIVKSRLCGMNLGASEAKNFMAFLKGSV